MSNKMGYEVTARTRRKLAAIKRGKPWTGRTAWVRRTDGHQCPVCFRWHLPPKVKKERKNE